MKRKIGIALCQFGLWVLNLGPRNDEDREMARQLIGYLRKFKGVVCWVLFLSASAQADHLPWILEWRSEPGVTFRLYVSDTPDGPAERIEMETSTAAYLPDIKVGEVQWYRVTATKNGHESEFSNLVGYIKPFVQVSPINGGAMFFFHRIPESPGNLRYTLEVSENLKDWTEDLPVEPKSAIKNGIEVMWIELPKEWPHLFSRIKVEVVPPTPKGSPEA